MTAAVVQLGVLALVLVVIAGMFACSEAALSRVSRARAAELLAAGRRGADALARAAADPSPMLSVATFLRVLAESGAAVCVTVICLDTIPVVWEAALAATALMAGLSFALVGVGPRTFGRQHADLVGLIAAPLITKLSRVLGPLARLLVLIGNALTPGRGFRDGPFGSEAELRELVDLAQETQLIKNDEREMIHSVFELGDTVTREIMVPRTDLVAIDRGQTLRSAMTMFLRSGFSRVPVVGEGLDDVLGVLYLKDVARRLHESPEAGRAERVEQVMRPPVCVPDSKPVDDLLREMQAKAGHIAIVVDEYGGTAGLVTLEDVVEEIVGDISDEYDHDTGDIEPLGEGSYRVRSRLHIEQLGDLYGLDLDDEEVDTVGGLLAKTLGRVPMKGSQVRVGDLVLTAEAFEGRRNQLATIVVEREASPSGSAEPYEGAE